MKPDIDYSVLREATVADLPAVNAAIEAAVMSWQLPERVKRLSLSSYRYDQVDLQHLTVMVLERAGRVIAVAGWEPADRAYTPEQQDGLLLHGLYVRPDYQQQGIGRHLLHIAVQAAREGGHAGLLVKAQHDAEPFFMGCGLQKLPVLDNTRHYECRYWLSLIE